MDVLVKDKTVEFAGFLNEQSPIETQIRAAILHAGRGLAGGPVRLDFSRVKRGNSCGVLAWFKLIDQIPFPMVYVSVPIWLVEQLNFIDALPPNVMIESIQAPFYCPELDNHETLTLELGRDIPIQDDYEDFAFVCTNAQGQTLEPDFEPGEYFHFITTNLGRFKGGKK